MVTRKEETEPSVISIGMLITLLLLLNKEEEEKRGQERLKHVVVPRNLLSCLEFALHLTSLLWVSSFLVLTFYKVVKKFKNLEIGSKQLAY